jgi:hypothetical protein
MTKETRYRYEQRIKTLERENASLRNYRDWALLVYEEALDKIQEDKTLSWAWALKQMKYRCFK